MVCGRSFARRYVNRVLDFAIVVLLRESKASERQMTADLFRTTHTVTNQHNVQPHNSMYEREVSGEGR